MIAENSPVPKIKQMTPIGFQKAFLKALKDQGGTWSITCEELEALPQDEAIAVKHDPETDTFMFQVVKVKQSPIIQPARKLIV